MSGPLDIYKTQVRILWEWRGGPWALVKRLVDHAGRVGDRVLADRLAAAEHHRRPRPRPRSSPSSWSWPCSTRSSAQSSWRSSPPVADPDRRPRPGPPDRRLPDRAQRGPGRPRRRLRAGPGRLVRVRDHQHGPDRRSWASTAATRSTGCSSSGLLIKGSAPPERQARARHHPDRRARPPDPRRSDARRLGQHDGRAGSATAATSCRAGRRSCRR